MFKNKETNIRMLVVVLLVFISGGVYLVTTDVIEEGTLSGENSQGSCEVMEGDAKDDCYYDIAKQSIDLVYCDFIENEMTQGMCNSEVENLKNQPDKELAQCKKLEDEDVRNDCIMSLATAKKDGDICENIASNVEKNACYQQVAKVTKNSDLCGNISDSRQFDSCVFEIAKAKNQPGECQKLLEESKQDECYRAIAIQIKSSELCEEIQDESTKFNCKQVVEVIQ